MFLATYVHLPDGIVLDAEWLKYYSNSDISWEKYQDFNAIRSFQ
jgi:hypothetical protein